VTRCRLLPQQYKVVTATGDEAAGENGDIYQACSFDYVGQMYPGTRLRVHDGERWISELRHQQR
jgi:hypothetical protein